MLLGCSLASSSFTLRKSLFLLDDILNFKADKMELSDEKELPEPHATGAHGQMELPDETGLPDEKGLHGKPSPQSVWGSEIC